MPAHLDEDIGGGRVPGERIQGERITGIAAVGHVVADTQKRIADGGIPQEADGSRTMCGFVSRNSGRSGTVFANESVAGQGNLSQIRSCMQSRTKRGQGSRGADIDAAGIHHGCHAERRRIICLGLRVGSQKIVTMNAAFGEMVAEQQ